MSEWLGTTVQNRFQCTHLYSRQRALSGSKPGKRADGFKLGLAIEVYYQIYYIRGGC